ncbi:MAG: alkaline phosphatase family protein, partial [Sciscionella sp.]|nr:alkaline phosphatase family protein [Sciscionella sp.]
TTNCAGAAKGTTVAYDESIDRDSSRLDAGQGLPALPGDIDKMTSTPQTLLDQAKLPVDPRTCEPVYPNQYVKVNNVFEVARSHDLRTAWSDKHPAYTILDGPSGTGVQDMFTPEINSTADAAGDDWTTVNSLTKQYDSYKVTAVRNEIDGYDHSRTRHVGVPAIFGLNFQTVSTAQKLPTSGGKTGGYQADGVTPGPLLSGALDYVDQQVGGLVGELRAQHLDHSTTVILSAKHGQSPQDPASLTRIDDGAVLDGLNGAWRAAGHSGDLVAGSSDDDAMLLWLTDRSPAATGFAKSYLASYSGNGSGTDGHAKATDINGKPKSYTSAGLTTIYAGADAARFIGVPPTDGRVPDLIGIANHGTVFTGGTKKIAEHGGDDPSDRDVALVVSGPSIKHARWTAPVETTQIAPTILASLGISPAELRAVRGEGTPVLPGTRR